MVLKTTTRIIGNQNVTCGNDFGNCFLYYFKEFLYNFIEISSIIFFSNFKTISLETHTSLIQFAKEVYTGITK